MNAVEVWRRIPGTDGQHEASSLGRIRSWVPWRNTPLPRIRKGVPDEAGYLCVRLRFDGRRTVRKVHMLVALAFHGPRPPRLQVRHLDGDQLNNQPSNLKYGTASENMLDKVRHGTHHEVMKTHCPQDHPYDQANTHLDRDNRRHCRTCAREQRRARVAAIGQDVIRDYQRAWREKARTR